jgi:adenylyl-sulfate kinase
MRRELLPDGARRRAPVFWLTGLSGAGKTTLAEGARAALAAAGECAVVLDGDVLRAGLCHDLGFSVADRLENMRRAAELARLLADAGVITLVALISPLRDGRALARAIVGAGFHEIWLCADLAACEARDPKGLYRRAREGRLAAFTGVASPYEIPLAADCGIDTADQSASDSVKQFVAYVRAHVAASSVE